MEDLTGEIVKAVNKMTEQDDTKVLLEFMREENKQFMAMMQMMMGVGGSTAQQQHASPMPSPLYRQSPPLPRPFAATQPGPLYASWHDSFNLPSRDSFHTHSSPLGRNMISPGTYLE